MNNKGFAITSVIYGLSILGIMIVVILMGTMSSARHNVSEEAKAVEEFLINYNQTEVTYRESGYYTVPPDETGWYRIEAFGKGTSQAKGTYLTGIVYLQENWNIQIDIDDNATELTLDGTKLMTAPAAVGNVPGAGFKCANKASQGGFVDMDAFDLKDKTKSLIGNDDVTYTTSGCTLAYINGHPESGTKYVVEKGVVDTLVLPGAYAGNTGKVIIRRLAEEDELTPTIPRKNHKFDKVKKILIDKGDNLIKINGIYYSRDISADHGKGSIYILTCDDTSNSKNVTCTTSGDDLYDIYIDFEAGNESKNLKNWKITLETASGNYVVYDSTSTLGVPIGTDGLHLSSFQPDSYTSNLSGSDNNFPTHGNYYLIPVNSENMVVSAVLNAADDGNQLKIEPITGESRQMWAIDMINAPGVVTTNFSGIPNQSGRKEYRIMELTRYKALNIYYDENYKINFVSASETFNTLSRNEPQIWNIYPMRDTTFAIKTVVPSFTLSEKSGFLFSKTAGDSVNNINDVMIGLASPETQGEADSYTLPTSIERFFLYSLDFSK